MDIDDPVVRANKLARKWAPLVIPEDARYYPTEIEQNRLELQEAMKVDLEKIIRDTADAALASLGAMVGILFVTTLAATALSALHNKKNPVLVTTLAAVLSVLVSHQNLRQLKCPIKVLSLKKTQFNSEVQNLKQQFLNRGIYVDAADFRKVTSRECLWGEGYSINKKLYFQKTETDHSLTIHHIKNREKLVFSRKHRSGTPLKILNEGYGLKFRCLLSYSHQSYNLTKPYKGLMIRYSVISFVVLLGNMIAAILVLTGNKTLGI